MDVLKDFHISFTGLKDGKHSFDFQIGKKFFDAFEKNGPDNSKILDSQLDLLIVLYKQENMLQLEFQINGQVEVACDRCTGLFWHPVHLNEMLIVKFGPETYEESENILVLSETEHEIQLEQYVFEYISLSLPMRLIHPEDDEGNSDCDLDFLESYQEKEKPEEEDIDPRWAALKNLKENNKR